MLTNQTVSYCNYIDLTAKILGKDRNKLRRHYGLPLAYNECVVCGELAKPNSLYCSSKCRGKHVKIKIECHQCGELFEIYASLVIYREAEYRRKYGGEKRWFCSHVCQGKRAGREYGFAAHPENKAIGTHRKYDYELIGQLLDLTSRPRLAKVLNMPYSSVIHIDNKLKELENKSFTEG